jgi:hypothetical protein
VRACREYFAGGFAGWKCSGCVCVYVNTGRAACSEDSDGSYGLNEWLLGSRNEWSDVGEEQQMQVIDGES